MIRFTTNKPVLFRRQENHDIAVMDVTVGQQRPQPVRGRRELLPVHKNMVADQKRVFHRAGRNFERLQNKRDDEQAGYQHSGQRRQKFDRRFLRFLFLRDFFFFFLGHFAYPL